MREHTCTYTMSLLAMYLYLHEDNVQPFQTYKHMEYSKDFGLLPISDGIL